MRSWCGIRIKRLVRRLQGSFLKRCGQVRTFIESIRP
jgi:hypothetical protein